MTMDCPVPANRDRTLCAGREIALSRDGFRVDARSSSYMAEALRNTGAGCLYITSCPRQALYLLWLTVQVESPVAMEIPPLWSVSGRLD